MTFCTLWSKREAPILLKQWIVSTTVKVIFTKFLCEIKVAKLCQKMEITFTLCPYTFHIKWNNDFTNS